MFNHYHTALLTSCSEVLMLSSKTCLNRSLNKKIKIGFQDELSLNAGQDYSLSYHLSLRSVFCLVLSGRLKTGFTVLSEAKNTPSN